jgi:beta-xylosidase
MLRAVMLWNEPNNLSHWDYSIDPQWAIYALMCRWAADAVRREVSGIDVVLGGIAPIDPDFVDLVVHQHGLESRLDVVAVHGFPFDWHLWQIDEWPAKVAEVRAVTRLPIWATEVGISSFGCEEVQVLGLRKTVQILPPLVDQIFWYSLFDLHHDRPAETRHREAEGSSYYRHFSFGLLTAGGRPKLALPHFPPDLGICQWLHLHDREQLVATVTWLKRLGVRAVRTGVSWADWHVPGALEFYDDVMRALEPFEVTLTLCFTPPSRGIRPHHTSPPVDPGEFAHFCAQVVRRYG